MNLVEEADEVEQRAAQPVDAPGHDHIKAAAGRVAKHGVELRTLIAALRAADAVIAVDLDNGPAGTLGDGAEVPLLVGGGLLVSANAKV